jgi:hypothetical protein
MVLNWFALFVAAMLGGALNSVAGGGTFITLPTLIFTGVPPVFANTTSTVALWPGAVASVGAYRKELATQKRTLLLLGGTSLVGGILGAVLLLNTPEDLFEALLPYLLLIATLLFTFGGSIARTLRTRFGRTDSTASSTWRALVGVSLLQLIISIYGGYFGGGIGFLMLAMLTLLGMENIHTMNALKTVLASCINGVAVLTFIFSAAVLWPQAIVMVGGAITGGYGGAVLAQRLDPQLVRRFVIAVGFAMTIYFFVR